MFDVLSTMLRTGILTEASPVSASAEAPVAVETLQKNLWNILGRALSIRHVDAGSCNGCELEIQALNNPYYNLEGAGVKFVASPRHADLLLVTGPVSVNMEEALRRTYDAVPDPKCCRGRRLRGMWRSVRRELRQPGQRRKRNSRTPHGSRLSTKSGGDSGWHPEYHSFFRRSGLKCISIKYHGQVSCVRPFAQREFS